MMHGICNFVCAWLARSPRCAATSPAAKCVTLFIITACTVATADDQPWDDPFYGYRVPVRIDVPQAGQYRIDVDAHAITGWMNEATPFTFQPEHFAYDQVRLVAVDEQGDVRPIDARFEITVGEELLTNGDFERQDDGWRISSDGFTIETGPQGNHYLAARGADRHSVSQLVDTQRRTWYRFACRKFGSAVAAPHVYRRGESWQPVDGSWRDPYIPPEQWRHESYHFYTADKDQWQTPEVHVRIERYTGRVDDLSMRQCDVALVARFDKPGVYQCLLYYAPLEGVMPSPPSAEVDALPADTLPLLRTGPTQRLDTGRRLTVDSNAFDLWHAPSTHKVLPYDMPPTATSDRIHLRCARNESEAIQLVLRPKAHLELDHVTLRLRGPDGSTIDMENVEVRRAHYVPITEPSMVAPLRRSRFTYRGLLPDPLPRFEPATAQAGDANILIWLDVHVPADAPAGDYSGHVRIESSGTTVDVPVELTVWDFVLPDHSTFRTAVAFSRYANQFLFPFHKVQTQEDKYALSRAYIAAMAKYRINAKGPGSAGVWRPDGPGQRQDAEAAIQRLAHEAPWAFDALHLRSFIIGHISGPSLEGIEPDAIEQTVDRYQPAIQWMREHDYLKWCFIQIDEPRPAAFDGVRRMIDGFRARSATRDVPMFAFVYNAECYAELRDHVDILTPINNDAQGVVSPQGIAQWPDDSAVWFYYTRTAHQWIDAPGINQRLWAPKVGAFGGEGFAVWGSVIWWNNNITPPHIYHNPWLNPMTTWGNGSLAYFYPPDRRGDALPKTDMTIVPSLRLLLTRDGIEDYEYTTILESLIARGRDAGIDVNSAQAARDAMRRPFITPRSWNVSEAYWLQCRTTAAEAIVNLQQQLDP